MDETNITAPTSTPTGDPATPEGSINFASYSAEQLRELQFCIDRRAYPETYANLIAALQQKTLPAVQPANPETGFSGQFTRHTGWRGWLSARRTRSPVYGPGAVSFDGSSVLLTGLQRTWLGARIDAQLAIDASAIRNVMIDETCVEFEILRRYRLPARIRFRCISDDQAHALLSQLPAARTSSFVANWTESRQFQKTLQELDGNPLITPAIVMLNVVVFIATAVIAGNLGVFTVQQLWSWGGNFGPLTVNGQWWRLLTSMFLHLSAMHLLFNMWALWNVGRLSERLFGRGPFITLYVATGIVASLSSVAWDPGLTSAGASGAIFGIFGAFLAFLLRRRNQLPRMLFRSHWVSTLAFVIFNLVSGALQPGVDNAAHVGGLLSGLVLGAIFARPLNPESRIAFPIHQTLMASTFIVTVAMLAIWHTSGTGSSLTGPELYARSHTEYVSGEYRNLKLWSELAARANAGSISIAELGQRFEQEILPFWKTQKDLQAAEKRTIPPDERLFASAVTEFTELRYQWASAVIEGCKNNDQSRFAEAAALMGKTTLVQAHLDRLNFRARMEHRPRALSSQPMVIRTREWLTGYHDRCVDAPEAISPPVAASDNQKDGPAIRQAVACEAQRLFMNGNYVRLDSLLYQYAGSLEDLPDGGSRYAAMLGGLHNLFEYGFLSADTVFGHTADWRRVTHNSVMAEIIEAMAFSDWAWAARGHDTANAVSSQNMAIYAYRSEMAAAALQEVADRANHNPEWFALSIDVGLDQSHDVEKLRSIFDSGTTEFPQYRPLYRSMMRILLPRWRGSAQMEEQFITEMDSDAFATRGHERYAELYSIYADLEQDEVDFFQGGSLDWDRMQAGYIGLIRRHPESDWILNRYVNFACRAGDQAEYRRLRKAVGSRYSSTAWSPRVSLESCDQKFKMPVVAGTNKDSRSTAVDRYESFGGIRLGLTREELQTAKGPATRQTATSWIYNALDAKHNGVLTAYFATATEDPKERVKAIDYVGDEESAPSDLPYLTDLSSVQILQRYGAQVSGHLVLSGPMMFSFANGIYVATRDEKVYAYGIYRPK